MRIYSTKLTETLFLLPPSMEDWLPDGHLARFIVEIVAQIDLAIIKSANTGRGSKAHHPEMLLALLFYGYVTGVFSSRKLEQATYDSVAFRYIAANDHPDHDTIAMFRKRFLPQLTPLFVQILLIAHQMCFVKLGKLEVKLKAEVADLLREAEEADHSKVHDGLDIPAELARREERLNAIADAKTEIERRVVDRHAEEQAAYEKTDQAQRQRARNPVASNLTHQCLVLGMKIRTTLRMQCLGLCQFPAVVLTNATMLRPVSISKPC